HHVVQHGAGGDVDQVAAVVDPLDLHTGRQQVGAVDTPDLALDAAQRRQGFGAPAHQHDAFDDIVVVVVTGNAEAWLETHRYGGNVGDQDRRSVAHHHHGAFDVVDRANLADAADDGRLRPEIDRVGADIDVGAVQRVDHLLQRKAVGQQAIQVDGDVVGLALAAPARDVDDARHCL